MRCKHPLYHILFTLSYCLFLVCFTSLYFSSHAFRTLHYMLSYHLLCTITFLKLSFSSLSSLIIALLHFLCLYVLGSLFLVFTTLECSTNSQLPIRRVRQQLRLCNQCKNIRSFCVTCVWTSVDSVGGRYTSCSLLRHFIFSFSSIERVNGHSGTWDILSNMGGKH